MKKFQAKDIQKFLNINRQRYEYTITKFGIEPDIEKVSGKGHFHVFSFKNVIQIAIAHQVNRSGMSPTIVKDFLRWIKDVELIHNFGILDPNTNDLKWLYIVDDSGGGNAKYFTFHNPISKMSNIAAESDCPLSFSSIHVGLIKDKLIKKITKK